MTHELSLTSEELWIVEETRRTGNLDIFTHHFMRLPNGGSMWMPTGDTSGHYRALFKYEDLWKAWKTAGRTDETLPIVTTDYTYELRVLWDGGDDPTFLLPHGYLFLDWVKPVVDKDTHIALVETGTGTGKTSALAIACLTYCALYPGFGARNLAPSDHQSGLMIEEMDKWVTNSRFRKFVKETRSGELYIKKPHALVVIVSPFAPTHDSTFECQTIGRNADNILGTNTDLSILDEVQLMTGVAQAIPKIVTRSRAQRSTGQPRWGKLIMLTNPGDNPEVEQIRRRIKGIQANKKSRVKALNIEGIDSRVNPYTTEFQMDFQAALMDALDKARWHGGDIEAVAQDRLIPEELLNRCKSEWLDDQIREHGVYNPEKTDGVGLIKYHIPYVDGHYYLVSGDPGQTPPQKLSYNNVGVITVFDITDFMVVPSRLVHFEMVGGDGTYDPWLYAFTECMDHYRAQGYYDATNLNTALEDAGAFPGRITTPLSFAVNNKRWSRGMFQILAKDGMFEWPFIEPLWYQAAIYRERGEGKDKLADDILASLFIYCLALRVEGTLWDKVSKRYHFDRAEEEERKRKEMQALQAQGGQVNIRRAPHKLRGVGRSVR
jgi:hypothetical protein